MDTFRIVEYLFGPAKTMISTLYQSGETSQILEPMSCLIRLSLLYFKEEGTKLRWASSYPPPPAGGGGGAGGTLPKEGT